MGRRDLGERKALRLALLLVPPALLAVAAIQAHGFGERQLNLSGAFADFENVAATVAFYLAAAWAAWIAVFLLIELIIATPLIPEGSYDAHLLRLIARVGSLLAAGGIVVYGANEVGIPALGLVAGLGVGGIALALAGQSTVENLFGGVSIFVDRPFRVGDFILYAGASGAVEQIGPRSTRLRGLDGTITTVPNADLAKMHVTNLSSRNKCLFQHVIGLRYETTTAQLHWLLDELRRRLGAPAMVEDSGGFPRVSFVGFGASAIEVDFRAYVLTQNWSEFLEVQEALLVEIFEIVEAAGSGFAFPSQTTYVAQDTGLNAEAAARGERRARATRPTAATHSRDLEPGPELKADATRSAEPAHSPRQRTWIRRADRRPSGVRVDHSEPDTGDPSVRGPDQASPSLATGRSGRIPNAGPQDARQQSRRILRADILWTC
jgi:MscS family membrane protein